MFERYTEKARRVIFFRRYEAQEQNNPLALRRKHGLEDAPVLTVNQEDVEQIIAK